MLVSALLIYGLGLGVNFLSLIHIVLLWFGILLFVVLFIYFYFFYFSCFGHLELLV